MKKFLVLITAAVLVSFNANAQSATGLELTRDVIDNPVQGAIPAASFCNKVTIVTATTFVSATWPAGTTDILFQPTSQGASVLARANAVGSVSSTANISNGSDVEVNPVWRRVNTLVSGTAISYYGVTSDVTGTVIRWCAYNQFSRPTR
ncbi:hypothetical protein EBT16_01840 [bacterium]|nr:hypothetical protein [bacterium]